MPNLNIVQSECQTTDFTSETSLKLLRFFPKSWVAKWHVLKKCWCHGTHSTHSKDNLTITDTLVSELYFLFVSFGMLSLLPKQKGS